MVPNQPIFTVEAVTRPTEYTLNWIPIFSFVRMQGEDYPSGPGSLASKSKWTRLAVVAAGPVMNLITAVFFFTLTSMSGVPQPVTGINLAGEEAPVAQTVITEVVPDAPAEAAGLQTGDIILGAEDVEFKCVGDLVIYVQNTKGTEVTLYLERNGEVVAASLVPRVNPPEGQGSMGLGITYEDLQNEIVYYPLHQAFVRGMVQTGQYVGLVFYVRIAGLREVFSAEAARPTGPVGIFQQTGSAVEAVTSLNWWFPVLWLTAILSIARIFVFPWLPHWDGARILFIIIEVFSGKRIIPKEVRVVYFIVLAVLITLRIAITYFMVPGG